MEDLLSESSYSKAEKTDVQRSKASNTPVSEELIEIGLSLDTWDVAYTAAYMILRTNTT